MCLVGVKTRRMENKERKIKWKMLFFTVWLEKENRRDKKQERKFSPRAHFFNPPKSGGKCGEKSVVKTLLYKYPHLLLIHDLMTFSSHPYLHSTPTSKFSSLFFFFFSTWPDQVDTKSLAQLNLYVHYCNFHIIII